MTMVKGWLWDSVGSQWVKALADSDGHAQVDVLTSALPSGAATSAKQDTMITALQLIDDLRNALGSVNTDDLQVDVKTAPTLTVQATGSDKIFAIESVVADYLSFEVTVGQVNFNCNVVPTAKIWIITWMSIILLNRAPTRIIYRYYHNGVKTDCGDEFRTFAASRYYENKGPYYLDAGDFVSIYLTGANTGDTVNIAYGGYQMDA